MNWITSLSLPTFIMLSSSVIPASATPPPQELVTQAIEYLDSITGKDGISETILLYKGEILWQGDNVDNVHAVWSATKSIMSTCLGLLWDDGKCHPDDLASKYLPALAQDYPTVTLNHLATFTSGISVERGELTPGKPLHPPGEAMHYSAQSDILALVLTKIAGEPLHELFRRRIAEPTGMDPSSWHWKSTHEVDGLTINGGSGFPEAGFHTNATNMARFGWLFAQKGKWDGKQLISERYIDYATRNHVAANIALHDPNGWYTVLPGNYGLNWWVDGVDAHGKRLWPHAPAGTFAAQGNRNNICIIAPEWELVIVRLGDDQIIDNRLYDGVFKTLRPYFEQ